MARASVLIVDDDAVFRAALRRCLEGAGYEVCPVADAESGLALLEQRPFDLVLTDLRMPGVGGIELVRRIKAVDADIVCIVVTGFGSTERSIEALEAGAFWFVDKSYDRIAAFSSLIQKGLEYRQLQTSNRRLQRQLEVKYGLDNIIGESDALKVTLRVVRKVAESDATVLVLGESGVGKELVARAVHYNSRRAGQPFVTINCGAIPEELLESELFGHVRGAFTGAVRERVGRFRSADGGTLFLDEIGDMSPSLQVKLLRVLQEREFEPVGSSHTESVDVRIIAATNQDLAQLIRERRFREDLYFRLSVVPIEVPPLRERREDIPLLVDHYLRELKRHHPGVEGITQGALKRLCEHDWPGNVRELVGTLERMVVLLGSGWLDERDVGLLGRAGEPPLPRVHLPAEGVDFTALVDAFETDLIRQALETTGWNKNQAAHLLDLKRTTLVEKIRAKGILPPDHAASGDSDESTRRAAPTES